MGGLSLRRAICCKSFLVEVKRTGLSAPYSFHWELKISHLNGGSRTGPVAGKVLSFEAKRAYGI